jgi:DNA-binding CsgD family transcriptional regulator
MDGIYNEQIISKTTADSTGYFKFSGNILNAQNRIYKIHTDHCNTVSDGGHFNGYCEDNYQVLFIANNSDSLSLPYGFERQVFCDIQSNNTSATALIQIDSLKEEMRFAYTEVRSAANRKLNNRKWFNTLQEFSKNTGDPLAELYTYAFLSSRSNEMHSYYLEDLRTNPYYKELADRLQSSYPESPYTNQYLSELQADRFMLSSLERSGSDLWQDLFYVVVILSLSLNVFLLYKQRRSKQVKSQHLRSQLSKQEQKVLELILEDKTNKDIAEQLFLSVSTVKTHTNSIYKKLKVQSRNEAKSLFMRSL